MVGDNSYVSYFSLAQILSRGKQVLFKNRRHALRRRRQPLKTHSRINSRPLKFFKRFVRQTIILVKHKIPNLYAVNVYLGSGTAGTFISRGSPKIILAPEFSHIVNAERFPNPLGLDIRGHFLVALKHAYVINLQSELIYDKLARVFYRFFFKISSERKIAEHLKKSKMRFIPDLVNVRGAETFLD